MPEKSAGRPKCFIAMPITVQPDHLVTYADPEHWDHVMHGLFYPAIEAAGFEPIPPTAKGTSMIHGRIIEHLSKDDLVLCDMSQLNPNVMFELGYRTSMNLPVALVMDEHLKLPFDLSGLNTHHYKSRMPHWSHEDEVRKLADHIRETAEDSAGENPLWKHFGVEIVGSTPSSSTSPQDAALQLVLDELRQLRSSAPALTRSDTPVLRLAVSDEIPPEMKGDSDRITAIIQSVPGVVGVQPRRAPAGISVYVIGLETQNQGAIAQEAKMTLARHGINSQIEEVQAAGFRILVGVPGLRLKS